MRNSQEMQLPFDFEFLPRFYEEKPQSPLDKTQNFSNSKSSFSNVNQSCKISPISKPVSSLMNVTLGRWGAISFLKQVLRMHLVSLRPQ